MTMLNPAGPCTSENKTTITFIETAHLGEPFIFTPFPPQAKTEEVMQIQ